MKYSKLFCLLLFFVFYSCYDYDNGDLSNKYKSLPIVSEIPTYHFDCDSITSEQQDIIKRVIIINSENQLYDLFNVWEFEMPDELKNFNYEQYSLLIGFYASLSYTLSIQHSFYLTGENEDSAYEYYRICNIRGSEDFDPENYTLYYFYSGILVNKIPDNSDIKMTTSILGID